MATERRERRRVVADAVRRIITAATAMSAPWRHVSVLRCSRAAGASTRFRVMSRHHRRTPPTTEAAQCMLSCRSTSAAHCRRACYGPRLMSEVDIYRQGQVQRVTSTRLAYYSLPESRKATVITPVHWRNQRRITFGLSQPISLSQR